MTEDERIRDLRPSFGLLDAKRIARRERLEAEIEQAGTIDDIKAVLRLMMEKR
ncbi:hypothetical protein [Mesorhizobium sp. WSM2239]|uniref:Uncharacterized protein n=2 Tax=unclassified Mesorhizobium TaxID=325217 RepID=A0AAU8D151_9HYPH